MKEETKAKISAAQKGKRRGHRPLVIDFDVERTGNGGIRIEFFNDVGGRHLADLTISPSKAARLAQALAEAVEEKVAP